MADYRIAVLAGDGIGPEITDAALLVLRRVATSVDGLNLMLDTYQAGAGHFRDTGVTIPDDVMEACRQADAVLLSAIGLPDVRKADGTEVQPDMMMGLRRELDLYAAVRPAKLLDSIESPLRTAQAGIDMVIVRENLEGLFASFGKGEIVGDQAVKDTLVITREGTERVVDFAFQLAQRRTGRPSDGRKLVTCVDKANIFRSFAFFRKIFFEVAARYPDVAAEAVYVDAMSLYMVQDPSAYDVLVMENQFGDILSDLAAGIVGGLGMAPSAEVGTQHALFQPSHGSAPQIAGQNIANPLAMILSAAMMLDWLGQRHDDVSAVDGARRIEAAVQSVLADSDARTRDIGGSATTSEMADAVAERIPINT